MPRPLAIGNGRMLINFDRSGYIRDLYYPYVGQLNHVGGYRCRIGVWTDGHFSWLHEPAWRVHLSYRSDSLVTRVHAENKELGISLRIHDGIHQRSSLYIKQISVLNHLPRDREVRLFFHQDLSINETGVGDTAAYYPENHSLFHYQKDAYFMFCGSPDFDQYTVGIKRFHNMEGTWRDAEDGHLMQNPIAQGSVDSTLRFSLQLDSHGEATMHYWMAAGRTLEEVKQLDSYVRENSPDQLLHQIHIYWQRWVNKNERDYADLDAGMIDLYKLSLLIIRTQTNTDGAIIAANDTDIMQYNRDHYSYMWPRDGALVASAVSEAGYQGMIVPFFHFCANALTPDGYLQHKYNPDGTIGSSWHPFLFMGKQQLPIQEDETALVLLTLWQDYEKHKVIELPQSLYPRFIRKAADFMERYIDEKLGLPKPSYDLWEERYGIFTFTASAVYGGLTAASKFSELFGDGDRAWRYQRAAERVQEGILAKLWSDEQGRFMRGLQRDEDGQLVEDKTLDSSLFAVYAFGVLPVSDKRVQSTMDAIRQQLSVKTDIGGIARYTCDYYFQQSDSIAQIPGNPWIICTLWMADYDIAAAETTEELRTAYQALKWTVQHALDSGILPEQLNPFSGEPLSVAPLTWSHATYVQVATRYIEKYHALHGTPSQAHQEQPLLYSP